MADLDDVGGLGAQNRGAEIPDTSAMPPAVFNRRRRVN